MVGRPPVADDVAGIVKGLTKAQREALDTLTVIARRRRPHVSGSALMALCRKGVARNKIVGLGDNGYMLTPLGQSLQGYLTCLAVRAHLTEGEKEMEA